MNASPLGLVFESYVVSVNLSLLFQLDIAREREALVCWSEKNVLVIEKYFLLPKKSFLGIVKYFLVSKKYFLMIENSF